MMQDITLKHNVLLFQTHCWDEENRLISFSDHCRNAGFYQYDANGVRTYKLTGGYAAQNIQGHWWSYNLLDNPTLYASPYVVATAQGYTKHYYAESERIASRIGNGGLEEIDLTVENIEDLLEDVWVGELPPIWGEVDMNEYYVNKQEDIRNHLTDVMMCAGTNPAVETDHLSALHDYWRYVQGDDETASEPDCYWYHPDHLGSSSWITYTDGEAVQHLHYLPWGEEFVDQRITDFSARHTFSAKERDPETGLSYFGARYYSSDLSIWLSVDPMSAKYPSLSPYVYCANNPVKLVDPNGEDWYVNQDCNIVEGTNKDDHTLYAVKGKKNEFGDRLIYRRGDQKGKEVSMPVDDEIMRSFKTDENGYSQMDLTGKEESGLEMMRFFSRHTNVEWSFWGGNTWDKESETESAFATIGTSHSYSKDEFSTIPILNASRKLGERHTTPLRFFIHTHPHQEIWGTWASRNDRKIKECCEICSPSAQFGIMHRGILYDYENNRIKISF